MVMSGGSGGRGRICDSSGAGGAGTACRKSLEQRASSACWPQHCGIVWHRCPPEGHVRVSGGHRCNAVRSCATWSCLNSSSWMKAIQVTNHELLIACRAHQQRRRRMESKTLKCIRQQNWTHKGSIVSHTPSRPKSMPSPLAADPSSPATIQSILPTGRLNKHQFCRTRQPIRLTELLHSPWY